MKITKKYLQKIIKEETAKLLGERRKQTNVFGQRVANPLQAEDTLNKILAIVQRLEARILMSSAATKAKKAEAAEAAEMKRLRALDAQAHRYIMSNED